MGLLQDLRNEVAIKSSYAQPQDTNEDNRELIYREKILPKMQEILKYISEVIEHIKYLEYQIEIENYSKEFPQFGTLKQTNYKLNTDGFSGFVDIEKTEQINISFDCQGIGSFSIQKEGQLQIENLIAYLHQKRINYNVSQINDKIGEKKAIFEINRNIPVTFRFLADKEKSMINFTSNNHNDFESLSKSYRPHEVDEKLLEQIARYMLRQDNSLIMLPISDNHINEIRQKLKYLELEKKEIINNNTQETAPKKSRIRRILNKII